MMYTKAPYANQWRDGNGSLVRSRVRIGIIHVELENLNGRESMNIYLVLQIFISAMKIRVVNL
jgi:hypothetical protein